MRLIVGSCAGLAAPPRGLALEGKGVPATPAARQVFSDGVVGVRIEKRKAGGGWQWSLGLRGKGALARNSWLWVDANWSGSPASWGRPPCLSRAVAFYGELLSEAAAVGIPATEVCWRALRDTLAGHPDHA